MTFQQKLNKAVSANNSLLCVGLDPQSKSLFSFCKKIIEQTHDLVCAYKPNSAFYEAYGAEGIKELKKLCVYIQKKHPQIPIILDAKRADIGNTNSGYVSFAFDYLKADAITVHPYLGKEALKPFLNRKDKGIIVLCRTSNEGAGEYQDLLVKGKKLYMHVAKEVSKSWNKNKNCLLVVGATYPNEMKKIRSVVGEMTFLVPGIGAQGGDVKKSVLAGKNSKGRGMITSASRSVLYAKNPRKEAMKLRDEINFYR